jgi:hypothetical protein
MMKYLRIPLILALILSPYWVGYLLTLSKPPDSDVGLGLFIVAIIGVPLVAVCGIIISFLTRNKITSNTSTIWSVMSYAIPALLICGYEFIGTLS